MKTLLYSGLRSTRKRWQLCCLPRTYSSTTSNPFRILFFGRDEFSCLVLKQLLQAKDIWQDIHVVTQPDAKSGRRGSTLSISPLKLLAETAQLQVHTIPPERSEFKLWKVPSIFAPSADIAHTPPTDQLLVTASFGRILPNSLLNHFLPARRLNVHPSLLPMYRGPAPIQHVLLDGQTETGVCVIEMTERGKGIDSGDIWASEQMDLSVTPTFAELRDELAQKGGQLLVSVMRDMLAGKDTRMPQAPNPSAPRASMITADDTIINFRTMSASHILTMHRAISHHRPLTTALKTGRTLQLHEPSLLTSTPIDFTTLHTEGTAILHAPSSSLIVRCAGRTYLQVPKVRQQDRAMLKAKEWWNGVKPEMRLDGGGEGPVLFVPFEYATVSGSGHSVRLLA